MALKSTNYKFPNQTAEYFGKVRDVYTVGDQLVVVASDRISAFDHILPRAIPHKGKVLNQIATHFLDATKDIVPNWLEAVPHPQVAVGKKCDPIRIEMVIRGYLAGHAWREYSKGKRMLCGVEMPEGMKEADRFPIPIITPATKAEEGHDEDISKDDILSQNIVSAEVYEQLENYTRALFQRGSEMALERGLLLVDTKYEFGMYEDEVILIDEIHTPDSSRFYYADGYAERQANGENQKQLSKEFVREWLMSHGFQGKDDQLMPEMPNSFLDMVTARYIELYEIITGTQFIRNESNELEKEIESAVLEYLN